MDGRARAGPWFPLALKLCSPSSVCSAVQSPRRNMVLSLVIDRIESWPEAGV